MTCAIIAHYACCCADTLASELGILASQTPFLVTNPLRNVPRGTNGGITYAGLFWSAIGGASIGLSTVLLDWLSGIVGLYQTFWSICGFGLICGLIGSLIDSLLGATVQSSYFDEEKKQIYSGPKIEEASVKHISGYDILSNAQVNLVSVLMTTALGGLVVGPLFFN